MSGAIAAYARSLGVPTTTWNTLMFFTFNKYDQLSGLDWKAWHDQVNDWIHQPNKSKAWRNYAKLTKEIFVQILAMEACDQPIERICDAIIIDGRPLERTMNAIASGRPYDAESPRPTKRRVTRDEDDES